MKDRVKEIINKKQLSSSKFADMLGIQRSSVSHILSGRNKTSLDIVKKILTTFKDINSDWLLFGVGDMYKTSDTNVTKTKNVILEQKTQEIIPQEKENKVKVPINQVKKEVTIVNQTTFEKKTSELEKSPIINQPDKIIILFPDNTFSTYNSK